MVVLRYLYVCTGYTTPSQSFVKFFLYRKVQKEISILKLFSHETSHTQWDDSFRTASPFYDDGPF